MLNDAHQCRDLVMPLHTCLGVWTQTEHTKHTDTHIVKRIKTKHIKLCDL